MNNTAQIITIIILITAGLLFLVCVITSSAEVLEVDDSGSKEYSYIQDAVENATDGDTILVYPGSYYENIQLNKTLNITGVDRENTVLIPSYVCAIQVNSENCGFSNLSFDGNQLASIMFRKGLRIFSNHTRITNCTFRDLHDGIEVSSSLNISVNECSFIENGNGLVIRTGSLIRINDCEFSSNHDGIEADNGKDIKIEDCQFRDAESHGILLTNASMDLVVYRCSFRDCVMGLVIAPRTYTDLGNGYISHCSFLGNNVGMRILGHYHSVEDCRLNGSITGLYIKGDGNVVNECTISNSSSYGIYINGEGNTITWNIIENGGYGIMIEGSLKSDHNIMMNNTFRNNSKGDIGEEYYSYHSGLVGVDVLMAVVAGFVVVGWKKRRRGD